MNLRHQYNRAKLTRIGWAFILLVFLISGVAVNSGNNLIYLTLSTLISYFLFSGFLSLTNIRGIEVNLKFPYLMFANCQAQFNIEVVNKSRDAKFIIGIETAYFREEFAYIESFSSVQRRVSSKFAKRGNYSIEYVFAKSIYPFSFFERKAILKITDGDFVVFPEIHNVSIKGILNIGSENSLPIKGESEELFSIRNYKTGDDKRKIAWKLSAKSDEEKVVDGAREVKKKIAFFIDNSLSAYSDKEDFEKAVYLIASAVYFSFQKEISFSLISPEVEIDESDPYKNLILSLSYLAAIEFKTQPAATHTTGEFTYRDVEII